MAATDLTTVVRAATTALGVSPVATFIHGSKALQNLRADGAESYPVVFLDSPRGGKYKNLKSGAILKYVSITYFVATKTKLDEDADIVRNVLNEMNAYAVQIFKAIINTAAFHNVDEAVYSEVEGAFDAHLTGVMVEMSVELTDIAAGC